MNLFWPEPANLQSVPSPALLLDADAASQNIQAMVDMVDGQPARLRPHVKTHKMPEMIRMQVAAGIHKFKAATLAEVEMIAGAGGRDVLLAYQVVGPNVARLGQLIDRFPGTRISTITDDPGVVRTLAETLGRNEQPLRLMIDVDCGMHRTGIELGAALDQLRTQIEQSAGVEYGGLHVYDGHLHAASLAERQRAAGEVIAQVRSYEQRSPSPSIVAGGSPTFACWAKQTPWECSPGTTVFWDVGYGSSYPDLEFSIAIALLTRVISKPGANRICLDLGYKAVASEMPLEKRVTIPALADPIYLGQSEEHLVIETPAARQIAVGQAFLAFPRHVCPTVALHAEAIVVRDGAVTGDRWRVVARDR